MDDENPAGGLSELTDVLGLLASDFESHPLSRSIEDCEAAGRAMREAKAEIERLRLIFRVNILRLSPETSHDEITRVLNDEPDH